MRWPTDTPRTEWRIPIISFSMYPSINDPTHVIGYSISYEGAVGKMNYVNTWRVRLLRWLMRRLLPGVADA